MKTRPASKKLLFQYKAIPVELFEVFIVSILKFPI